MNEETKELLTTIETLESKNNEIKESIYEKNRKIHDRDIQFIKDNEGRIDELLILITKFGDNSGGWGYKIISLEKDIVEKNCFFVTEHGLLQERGVTFFDLNNPEKKYFDIENINLFTLIDRMEKSINKCMKERIESLKKDIESNSNSDEELEKRLVSLKSVTLDNSVIITVGNDKYRAVKIDDEK